MAREYARLRISIADDPDFEELPVDAQWLYARVLIPEPSLSYCGVADWRPNRLTTKAVGADLSRILAAAGVLEERRYVLFDLVTEEALVRTYIRNDELLRNPKMALSVVKAYQGTASKTLRAAVVTEIRKAYEEHPDYSSWTHRESKDALARLLSMPGLDSVGYTNRLAVPITNGITNPNAVPNTNRNGNPDPGPEYQSEHQSDSVDFLPATATLNIQHATQGGYVSPEGHQASSSTKPPTNCSKHPNGTTEPCRACGDARQARKDFDRQAAIAHSATVRAAADARADEIAACELCDEDGYQGGRVCDHDPDSEQRSERGRAAVRAALAAKSGGFDA